MDFTYRVKYNKLSGNYIATCDEYPDIMVESKDSHHAHDAIRELVNFCIKEDNGMGHVREYIIERINFCESIIHKYKERQLNCQNQFERSKLEFKMLCKEGSLIELKRILGLLEGRE